MEFAGVTDIGRQRGTNEDSCCVEPLPGGAMLLVVADGMGGHQAGEVASRLAVESLLAALQPASETDWRLRLLAAVAAAHERIRSEADSSGSLLGMGTTVTAAVVDTGRALEDSRVGRLIWAHVGDSRAYLWRAGELLRLTEDHSLVGEMVRDGQLAEDEAMQHPQRNVLTRALGTVEAPAIDSGEQDLRLGDWVLLATDGLTNLIGREELGACFREGGAPGALAQRLVDLANGRGGPDNITVVIARA